MLLCLDAARQTNRRLMMHQVQNSDVTPSSPGFYFLEVVLPFLQRNQKSFYKNECEF